MTKYCIVLLSLISLSCGSTPHVSGWVLLGQRTVDHLLDRDEIRVGGGAGTFQQLKLVVERRSVEFRAVEIYFANGETENVVLRSTIPADGESRVIDLIGRNRIVRRVVFSYFTDRRAGKRAVVLLYGRR